MRKPTLDTKYFAKNRLLHSLTITILLTCLTANLSQADSSFGYAATCHPTQTAVNAACNFARLRGDALEQENGFYECIAITGGTELRAFGVTQHTYVNAEQNSSCDAEYAQIDGIEQLVTILDNDLATAESNILALETVQDAHAVTIGTHTSQISNLQTLQQQNSTNLNTAIAKNTEQDTRLDVIDGVLVTEQQRIDLIEFDINTLHSVNASQDSAIQFNELYIEGVELEFETFQSERVASDAATNSYLTSQQFPLLQGMDTRLSEINDNIELTNDLQEVTKQAIEFVNQNIATTNILQESTNNNLIDANAKNTDSNTGLSHLFWIQNGLFSSAGSEWLSDIYNQNVSLNANSSLTNQKLDQIKTSIEAQSFEISGENISIDNSGVETRLDSVLTEQQLQKAEMVRTADAIEAIEISLTVDPSQADDSYVNAVSQYLKSLWEQDLVDYDNAIREAIEAAQLENAGLDVTEVEIIGAQMTGWAAAQTCADYNFNLGQASFPLYCIKTEPFRNILAWAFFIMTAYTIFNTALEFRSGGRLA